MMVHRLLARYLEGGKSADKETLEALCVQASEREIVAAEAERASIKYKMVEFMKERIGQEFDGHISGLTEWGVYVELDETHIEACRSYATSRATSSSSTRSSTRSWAARRDAA